MMIELRTPFICLIGGVKDSIDAFELVESKTQLFKLVELITLLFKGFGLGPVSDDTRLIGIVTRIYTHVIISTDLVHWKHWTQTAPLFKMVESKTL